MLSILGIVVFATVASAQAHMNRHFRAVAPLLAKDGLAGLSPGSMATYSLANERLRALEDIEREIGAILQNAGSGSEERMAGRVKTIPGLCAQLGRSLNASLRAGLSL